MDRSLITCRLSERYPEMERFVSPAGADSRALAPHSLREWDLARCSRRRLSERYPEMERFVSPAGADSRALAPHSLREWDLARCSRRRLSERYPEMERFVSPAGADSRALAPHSLRERDLAHCSQRHLARCSLRHHRFHSPVHFIGRHVLGVGRNRPYVPCRIGECPAAVAVELVLDRMLDRSSGGECLGELRVHIGNVEQQRDRRSAERLWPVVAHLGRFVREHHYAVADLDL